MADRLELAPEGLTDGQVRVRHLHEGDAQAYAGGAFDMIGVWLGRPSLEAYTSEEVRAEIRTTIADGLRDDTFAVLAIADAADDRFLGSIVLFDLDWATGSGTVGFWVSSAERGAGVAGRALDLVCDWCFGELGLGVLYALAEPGDRTSRQVLEQAGFRRASGFRPAGAPTGNGGPTVVLFRRRAVG
ncbi:MAG TPA: GNAT family protein [Pseudonocardiaceae bacterium]